MTSIRLATAIAMLLGTALACAQELDRGGEEARRTNSQLALGSAQAKAGALLRIPLSVHDATGTPLGLEKDLGASVQSIAVRVRVQPSAAVVDARIERAGVAANATPRFEVTPRSRDGVSWLAVFDAPASPLQLTPRRTSTVAVLHLRLAENLVRGDRIELRLDAEASVLANAAGTIQESAGNGWLALRDGLITVR
jgi:hypothetical protein